MVFLKSIHNSATLLGRTPLIRTPLAEITVEGSYNMKGNTTKTETQFMKQFSLSKPAAVVTNEYKEY